MVSAAQSKIPKADPGRITELQGFDYLCYHDDKRLLASDTLSDGVAFLKATGSALGLRPHPHLHGNILFEFSESLGQSRYKSQEAQMAGYISEQVARGYRLRSQLYWTGAILRNMKHPDTAVIDRTWLDHIGQCGIECQISFDFIAQRFPSIALLPIDLLVV